MSGRARKPCRHCGSTRVERTVVGVLNAPDREYVIVTCAGCEERRYGYERNRGIAVNGRQRAPGSSTEALLEEGERWRRNGTMRFLRLDTVDREARTVTGTFSDGAIACVEFRELRARYTRVDGGPE